MDDPVAAELLERAVLHLLASMPTIPEPMRRDGMCGGRTVAITVTPSGWSQPLYQPTPALTPCERLILDVLAGRSAPVTRYGIMAALRQRGRHYAESTVAKALARLTADGLLVNDHNRTGYRRS